MIYRTLSKAEFFPSNSIGKNASQEGFTGSESNAGGRCFARENASRYEFGDTVTYEIFDPKEFCIENTIRIGSKKFITLMSTDPIDWNSILNGRHRVIPADSSECDLDPLVQCAILEGGADKYYAYYELNEDTGTDQLVVCDLDKLEYKILEYRIIVPFVEGSYIYGFDKSKKIFFCLGVDGDIIWEWKNMKGGFFFHFGSSRILTPCIANDFVICYFGTTDVNRFFVDGHQSIDYKNSYTVVLDKNSGKLIWDLELEFKVDDYIVEGGFLYICHYREILVYDLSTGTLLFKKPLPMSEGMRVRTIRDNILNKVDDGFFFCDAAAQTIVVLDKNLKDRALIQLPEGWTPRELQYHDAETGKLYFHLDNFSRDNKYVCRTAVLILDKNNLNTSPQLETPNANIKESLKDGEDGKKELWIEIDCPSLDDALRFGELYTRDYSWYYGKTLMDLRYEENKDFNGKVHFRYSGSAAPREEIDEKLKLMEKRFAWWNEKRGVCSGDGKATLCSLEASYSD